ncbi:hypothetical protein BDY24DRAFT_405421 [Mrakia frigida]|uniref:O-fucosyltransferase family protein n=1 Tax=Mrakia frigida TaxID=29902 RepID=UPI003FCC038C
MSALLPSSTSSPRSKSNSAFGGLPLPTLSPSLKSGGGRRRSSTASFFGMQSSSTSSSSSSSVPRRFLFALLCFILLCIFPPRPPFPQNYKTEWSRERALGNLHMENKQALRLLMMQNNPKNTCINSQILLHLLQHHLATSTYLSKPRTYVFQPYVLPPGSSPFAVFSSKLPSIPFTAFLNHFLASPNPKSSSPGTISLEDYEQICPESERVVLGLQTPTHTRLVWEKELAEGKWRKGSKELVPLPSPGDNVGVDERLLVLGGFMESWKDERCLEIKGDLVEFLLANGGDVVGEDELWDVLKNSEGVKGWKWGERIVNGVNKAVESLVGGGGVVVGAGTGASVGVAGVVLGKKGGATGAAVEDSGAAGGAGGLEKPEVLVGLLAVHIPQILSSQCEAFSSSTSNFTSFSRSPVLSDRFPPISPALSQHGKDTIYFDHCAPSIERVLARSGRLRREHPRLRSLFVGGMAEAGWRERKRWKEAFEKAESEGGGGWERVYFEGDLGINSWGMKELGTGVSMELMRRSEVFIGNGFSSLTSNVVMLRQRDSRPLDTTRFW